jgi:hypothetical protein
METLERRDPARFGAALAVVGRAGLLGLCLLLGRASAEVPPSGARADCGTPLLRVDHSDPADLEHACEAWRRVSGFLVDRHGLRVAAPFDIVFTERVELDLGTERLRVLGHFDRQARVARVTSMSASWLGEPDRLMFRLPVDAELHTSVIAHELAHAVVLDNVRVAVPARTSGEYLAYVVQLMTMAPVTRARVLAEYEEGDFASLDDITEIRHLMRPHEFGVRAYRHFVREGHGYMLDLILSGGLQTDLPPY